MATAKQIAAREKFAEMARSGALAKKRKTAAKKVRGSVKPRAQKTVGVKKNPVAPKKNPTAPKPVKRFLNPRDSFPFKVYKAGSGDRPTGSPVGAFKTRTVALAFANGYAKMYDCAVVLVGD